MGGCLLMDTIEFNLKNMLTMLEELVNTDSGSYDKNGVDKVGTFLKRKYEKFNFNVMEKENHELGNHLLISHKQAIDPKILILAHMDTVFPEGTATERPFTIKDGRAYGPGVIDMKASHVMLRSEEHTSELQSRGHLVCRLLLEKKKKR